MSNKVSATQQKQNETSLLKAYKALGESISCTGNISITNETGMIDSFKKVDVVLAISKKNSYIEIECQEKDEDRYTSLGLDKTYYVSDAIMKFEEHRDYQTSVKWLQIKPVDVECTIHIKLKK